MKQAESSMMEQLPVKLYPEPDNPIDSKAIAFIWLFLGKNWIHSIRSVR